MNQETPTSTMSPILLTFLAGATVGAVIVALTTPKTGPELRGDLKDLAHRARCKAGQLAEGASSAWDELKEGTRLAANDVKRGITADTNDIHS